MNTNRIFSSWKSLAAFCLIAFLLIFIVSSLILARPNPDEGIHTTTAWLLLQGILPYRDVFSMYAPGSYFIFAAFYLLFPLEFVASRLFVLAINVLTLVAFFALCRKLMPERLALLACLLYIVLSVFTISWNIVLEPFITLFAVLSFYFIFSFLEGKKLRHLVLACLFLSSLVLMKQTMLFLSLGMAVFLLLRANLKVREFFVGLVSYAFFPVLFLFYLVSNNALLDFVQQAIIYNLSHSSLFAFRFHLGWVAVTGLFLSVSVLAFLLLLFKKIRLGRDKAIALFLWIVLSLPILLPVLGCCGHHLLLVPGFVIFFMLCFEALFLKPGSIKFGNLNIGLFLKIFLSIAFLAALFGSATYLSQYFFQNDFEDLFEISEYIASNSGAEDRIFVTYWDEELYFFSLRKPATKYLFHPFFFEAEEAAYQDEVVQALQESRPLFVVDFSRTDQPLTENTKINAFVLENYSVVKVVEMKKPLYKTFNYGFVLRRDK